MQINKKRKLKNFIINPKYQLRYVFWLTSSGFVLVLINAILAYSYIKENYVTLVDLSPMTDDAKSQLYRELRHLIFALSGVSILFLIIVIFLGIILSHRTAGPLYHFMRVFETISKGDTKARIRLRPNDEFQEVAASFNQMMDSVTQSKK